MSDRPGSDKLGILVAVLGGLFVALVALLVVYLTRGDGASPFDTTAGSTQAATTTEAPTSTAASSTSGGSSTSAGTTTSTAATTTTTTTVPFSGDTAVKTGAGAGGLLTGVRIGDHEGYTRIVFDFQEPTFPNWEFVYVPGEIHGMADPEGGWVEGDAYLMARFQPSGTADLSGTGVVMTYEGARRIDVGVGSVVQLLIVEDFEANLWWAIGLTGEKPFSVGTMTAPPRVYVDVGD